MAFWTDLNKTIRYAQRNGLRDTYYAAIERLRDKVGTSYSYEVPALGSLEEQRSQWEKRRRDGDSLPLISFLVLCISRTCDLCGRCWNPWRGRPMETGS